MTTNSTNSMPTGTTNSTNSMPTGTTNSTNLYEVSLTFYLNGDVNGGIERTLRVVVSASSEEEAIRKASEIIDPLVFFTDFNLFLRNSNREELKRFCSMSDGEELKLFRSMMEELDSYCKSQWEIDSFSVGTDGKAENQFLKSHRDYEAVLNVFIPMMKCVEIKLGTTTIY